MKNEHVIIFSFTNFQNVYFHCLTHSAMGELKFSIARYEGQISSNLIAFCTKLFLYGHNKGFGPKMEAELYFMNLYPSPIRTESVCSYVTFLWMASLRCVPGCRRGNVAAYICIGTPRCKSGSWSICFQLPQISRPPQLHLVHSG